MKWWKRHGAKVILALFIISAFISTLFAGVCCLSMITIPCGVKKINDVKWMWYTRQIYFILVGALLIYFGIKL